MSGARDWLCSETGQHNSIHRVTKARKILIIDDIDRNAHLSLQLQGGKTRSR